MSPWVVLVRSSMLAREDVSGTISAAHSGSRLGFWRQCLWIPKPVRFCEFSPFFTQFHSVQEDWAATQPLPATPHLPCLSFQVLAQGLMTKEAPGGRALRSEILWCPAWAGVREGGVHPRLRRRVWSGSLSLFPRCKALVMRLIVRRDRNPLAKVS